MEGNNAARGKKHWRLTAAKERNVMIKKALMLCLVIVFAGCAGYEVKPPKKTEMVQHIKGSVFSATDKGFFTTELVMTPRNPVVGKSKANLIIHDYEAHDTPGLDITVLLYMPETGVQSSEKPVVTDVERGLYRLENLYFQSPGIWQMKLNIKGPRFSDTVVLSLPEVKE